MKEYKIVCDKYEKHSKIFGGKEYSKTNVNPITSGSSFCNSTYKELDDALKALYETAKKVKEFDKENNSKFTEDGSVIYREQKNIRIISREVSDWEVYKVYTEEDE